MPQPGDALLTRIPGRVGLGIRVGERLLDGKCAYQHMAIVEDDVYAIEARPGGVSRRRLDSYDPAHTVFSSDYGLIPEHPELIVARARWWLLKHAGYSYLDYLAIALHRWQRSTPLDDWAERRVISSQHVICSQMGADCQAHDPSLAGLYDTEPYLVTPGDAYVAWLRWKVSHGG